MRSGQPAETNPRNRLPGLRGSTPASACHLHVTRVEAGLAPHREVGFETSRPCDHRSLNRILVLTEPGLPLFELKRHHVTEPLYGGGPPKLGAFRERPEVLQGTTGLNCPAKKKAYLGEVGFSYFSP